MSQNDDASFYREVDEDYRREQMVRFWKRYGIYVIVGVVLVVAVVLGYSLNKQRNQADAARGGDALINALVLQEEGKADEAKKAFAAIAETGPATYRVLAKLQAAADATAKGQRDVAAENYRIVSSDADAPADLRDFARLQLASLSIETANYDKLAAELAEYRNGTSHWRFIAKEVLGLVAFKDGKRVEAERLFAEIKGDPASPQGMRQRAEIMLALLLEAPKAETAAQKAKGETPNAAKTQ